MGVVFKSRDRRVGFFQIAGSCLDVSGGASVRGVRASRLRRFAVGQVTQSLVGHAYSKNSKNRSIFRVRVRVWWFCKSLDRGGGYANRGIVGVVLQIAGSWGLFLNRGIVG